MNGLTIFAIFFAGGAGSTCRFVAGYFLKKSLGSNFPFSTLIINILACWLAGWLVGRQPGQLSGQLPLQLILITGFCGGFSTFSAFSLETWELVTKGRYLEAAIYITISISFGITAFVAGLKGS